jgi:S1-C subfamily serine protease
MVHRTRVTLVAAAMLLAAVLKLGAAPAGPVLEDKKLEAVIRSVFPSVVKVEAGGEGRKKVAAGVVMDNAGYIVTTALISSWDKNINVVTADGRRLQADFLGLDPETHIAVLKVKEKVPAVVALSSAAGLASGAWIAVLSLSPENKPAVTQGIVSSASEEKIRLNVWVVPGSSGSPVIDAEGRMIGLLRGVYFDDNPVVFEFREREFEGSGFVISRGEAPAAGMAVAVPIDTVKAVFQEIKDKGKVSRGWLGVGIAENEDNEVVIADVDKDSPASLAKLREGDRVLKIDGKPVTEAGTLASEIRKRKPGQEVTFLVEREGKTVEAKVKLGEYTEENIHKEMAIKFPMLFDFPIPPKGPQRPAPPLRPFRWEKRKYIGVFLQETTKGLAEYFGLRDGAGLLINELTKDGPAEKAGLRVGDVIFKADGKRVNNVLELSAVVQTKKKGDKVKIEYMRDKKALSVMVEVAEQETGGLVGMMDEGYFKSLERFFEPGQKWTKGLEENYEKQMKEMEKSHQEWEEKYSKQMEESRKKIDKELKQGFRTTYRSWPLQRI